MLYILFMCNCSTMCAVTGMVLAVGAVLKECDIQLLVVLYSSVCVRACVCPCMCACVRAFTSACILVSLFIWCVQLNSTRDVSSLQTGDGERACEVGGMQAE